MKIKYKMLKMRKIKCNLKSKKEVARRYLKNK